MIDTLIHSPRTGRGSVDSAHGWASGRSISSAQMRCVGGMDVVELVYTACTAVNRRYNVTVTDGLQVRFINQE